MQNPAHLRGPEDNFLAVYDNDLSRHHLRNFFEDREFHYYEVSEDGKRQPMFKLKRVDQWGKVRPGGLLVICAQSIYREVLQMVEDNKRQPPTSTYNGEPLPAVEDVAAPPKTLALPKDTVIETKPPVARVTVTEAPDTALPASKNPWTYSWVGKALIFANDEHPPRMFMDGKVTIL